MSVRKVPNDEILYHLYIDKKMSSGDIAKIYGCARGSVCKHIRRLCIVRPESGANSRNRNYNKKQYRSGYPVTFLPEHPRANNLGYVFDHILVLEKHTGITPIKGQEIHHIDCVRTNIDLKNLILFKNHTQHLNAHYSINELIKPLLDQNIIKFNRKKGIYEMV